MPALKEREATRKATTATELAGSLVLHALLVGGALYSGLLFHSRSEKWGDSEDLAGAVQATMVTAIPLPPRVPPKEDNVLASDSPSVAPPRVKEAAEPPPKPTDVPVPVKKAEKQPPKKVADRPSPVVPKIQQPRPEPEKATSGTTGGVRAAMLAMQTRVGTSAVNITDESFGARFGYYVRQMNQRISQQWLTATLDPDAQGRRVYMTFRVDRGGQISEVRIVQSSGDRTLDASAARTLERVDTLSPLPEAYSGSYIIVRYYFEPS